MTRLSLHSFLLLSVLFMSSLVRLYALDTNPVGFFCDEAAIGYNAYTILTTGKDEYGELFPIFFRSFGEFKSPIAIYAAVPFIQFFGLNEFAVRLQSVIFGIVTIFMVYLMTKELFSKNAGLLAAAVAASMPWLIHYNRTAFEMNSYIAFFTAMVFLLLRATKDKRFIIPAFFVSTLTLYTYYSAKLIIPLFIFGFLLIYRKKLFQQRKEIIIAAVIFLILSIPFFISFLNGAGTARFNEVSVFTAQLSVPDTILRMLNNYFFQLSPTLFIDGEATFITRHFTNGLTPLLLITVPFFYIGIGYLMYYKKKKSSQLLLLWLLLYPIGAAVVADPPFTGRTIIGAPLSAILIALGIKTSLKLFKHSLPRQIAAVLIVLAVIVNLSFFVHYYFTQYPRNSADFWGWQAGPKDIISYFEANKTQYDEFYMVGEFNAPHIFFKFYAPHGCEKCLLGAPHEVYKPNEKQLFAISPFYQTTHPEFTYTIKKTIFYPNGSVAFVLSEVNKKN